MQATVLIGHSGKILMLCHKISFLCTIFISIKLQQDLKVCLFIVKNKSQLFSYFSDFNGSDVQSLI